MIKGQTHVFETAKASYLGPWCLYMTLALHMTWGSLAQTFAANKIQTT